MRSNIIFKTIKNQRQLNLIVFVFIFGLFLIFIYQWNLTYQVYGLYFGNSISINSGNVSSSFTRGQIDSIERGYMYVVWVDKNITYFSFSQANDTTFSYPIALSSNATLASSPLIAATNKGDVYVVWIDKNKATGDSNVIFRGSNDNGKNFDGDVRLNRNAGPNQTSTSLSPQLVATEKGDVYVVWIDKKEINGDTNIAFITSNNTGKDFAKRKFLRANNLLSFSPQIDATEKGDVYVVWIDKNKATGDSNVIFRGSNDNGKDFDHAVRLNRNVNPNQTSTTSYPQISATNKGDVYVVWIDKNKATGDSNVRFRSSNNNGKNFDHSVLLNRNPNQTSLSFSPQLAATNNGSVYVVWSENSLQFKEILNSGAIFGRTISLSSHVVLPLSIQIVVTENGNIYLAWAEKDSNANPNNDIAFVFKKISQFYFDRE